MKVRRTGGKKGESVTWYVGADSAEEQVAIRAGLLEEKAPDARWRYVLAWGYPTRQAAIEAMEKLRPVVEAVVEMIITDNEIRAKGELILARIFAADARLDAHWTELRVLANRLTALARELDEARIEALAGELERWIEDGKGLRCRLVDTVQMACLLHSSRSD